MGFMSGYTATVVNNLPGQDLRAMQWLDKRDEKGANDLIEALQGASHPTSKKRYRFNSDLQSGALKAIFEASFKDSPQFLTRKAEAVSGKSFYPLWKRVCKIDAPRAIGSVLGNTCFKIVAIVATGYFGFVLGHQAYIAVTQATTARALPFIINNTPLSIIRLFNSAMSGLEYIFKNSFNILVGILVAKGVARLLPNIPYFTATTKAVDFFAIWKVLYASPQTLSKFLTDTSVDAGKFVWSTCNEASKFFNELADKAVAERAVISKAEAYKVWLQSVKN